MPDPNLPKKLYGWLDERLGLTEIAAVCHETTDNDNDPNISAFGVYGVLFDQSVDHIADCPTKALADAVAEALNKQYGKEAA